MRPIAIVAAVAFTASGTPSLADRLVIALSANQVVIGSNYAGTQLALFGVIERDAQSVSRASATDVIVTVRGPREYVTVRLKEPLGPLWINKSQQKFIAVPNILGVSSSRPLNDIAGPAIRRRLRLGLNEIVDAPEFVLDRDRGDDDRFRRALVRLRMRDGLWTERARDVVFVTEGLFRAPLPLPATAPTGNYDVEVLLISGGAALARANASFEVIKAGLEEQITSASQDHSILYGLAVAALSVTFGWIASIIFRRD